MAISVSPKTGIGERLKEARQRRGLDLQEVSRVTRIKPRLLDALEKEAPPRAFGAPVYARAFLRTYARYLGLPAESLVEEYHAVHGERDATPMRLPQPVRPPRRRSIGHVLLALVTAGALVALGVVTVRDAADRTAEDPGPPAGRMEDRSGGEPAGPADEATEELRLRVRLPGGPSWLRLIVDGEVAVRGRRTQGFDRVFRAERRIVVEIDDGGAARLILNGERLGPPAASGVSYRETFVLRDGEVRTLSDS
jgi:cytoskeleton protein RodZ